MGDEPITIGKIFAAASVHDDASVVEQPAFPGALCEGISASFFAGGICDRKDGREAKRQRSKERKKIVRRGMSWRSFPGVSAGGFRISVAEQIIPKES
jgi:hypothetical protein